MAAPTVPGIQGLRGTGSYPVDHRPTNYRETFNLLEPNGNAPLNALLANAASESTDDPKYNNFRDHLPDRTVDVASITTPATSTDIVLVDSDENNFVAPNAVLMNDTSGEIMWVSSYTDGTNTVVVTRNIGGTSLSTNVGDTLSVVGTAYPEGADVGTPISWDAKVAFNYAEIFRNAYQVTGTLDNTYLRTGDHATEKQAKTLKVHMSDIERAMLWGQKHVIDPATDQPTYFTGGFMNEITTIVDCAGAGGDTATDLGMTEAEFDVFIMDQLFAWGSNERIVFCDPIVATHLIKICKDRWQPYEVQGTYGVSFTRYVLGNYSLLLHVHPQFRQVPAGRYSAMFIDFADLCYRYVENRDTHLLTGRQSPGVDGFIDEYLTQCGLEMKQDLPHAAIKNWQLVG